MTNYWNFKKRKHEAIYAGKEPDVARDKPPNPNEHNNMAEIMDIDRVVESFGIFENSYKAKRMVMYMSDKVSESAREHQYKLSRRKADDWSSAIIRRSYNTGSIATNANQCVYSKQSRWTTTVTNNYITAGYIKLIPDYDADGLYEHMEFKRVPGNSVGTGDATVNTMLLYHPKSFCQWNFRNNDLVDMVLTCWAFMPKARKTVADPLDSWTANVINMTTNDTYNELSEFILTPDHMKSGWRKDWILVKKDKFFFKPGQEASFSINPGCAVASTKDYDETASTFYKGMSVSALFRLEGRIGHGVADNTKVGRTAARLDWESVCNDVFFIGNMSTMRDLDFTMTTDTDATGFEQAGVEIEQNQAEP